MRAWCVCLTVAFWLSASLARADCAPIPDGGVVDDTDGDGVSDVIECGAGACRDTDGDMLTDRRDPDDDNDGIPTCEERPADEDLDTDGDGTADYLEADDDGDGVPTLDERPGGADRDTDKDKKPDHLDADDDGDGIPTRLERIASGDRDTDNDKKPDHLDTDDDGDGVPTADEGDASKDTDQDNIPDYLDATNDPIDSKDGGAGGLDAGAGGTGGGTGGGGAGSAGGAGSGGSPLAPGEGGLSGGGLCSVGSRGPAGALWLFALGVALLVCRRRAQLLAVGSVLFAAQGSAQVPIESYRASPFARDGFTVPRPETPGHLRWAVSVAADYTKDSLLFRKNLSKDSDLGAVIGTGVYGHVAFGLGLGERFAVHASLPVSLVMSGDAGTKALAPAADGAGLMDTALGARALLYGDRSERLAVAAELVLHLPTARLADDGQHYLGEPYGSAEPALFGEARLGRVALGARAGARFRKASDVANIRAEHELVAAGALRVRVIEDLEAQLEVFGATPFGEVLDRERSPIEALLGVRGMAGDLHFGVAAGPGLTRGFGAPQVRALGLVGYAPGARPKKQADAPPKRGALSARVDSDRDGLVDANDACPTEPEDRDGHDDVDGCPDADNDQDGVPDTSDKCQGEFEDTDDFEDGDGCPDDDNDADGLSDADDQCPDVAEDKDGLADEDGCPEEDADGDQVPDKDDACPSEPGIPDALGCPLVME